MPVEPEIGAVQQGRQGTDESGVQPVFRISRAHRMTMTPAATSAGDDIRIELRRRALAVNVTWPLDTMEHARRARRRHDDKLKLKVLSECAAPGASVAQVAWPMA